MAAHSSILACRIPWIEEPGGLQSMGSQESDTTEQLSLSPTLTVGYNIVVLRYHGCTRGHNILKLVTNSLLRRNLNRHPVFK